MDTSSVHLPGEVIELILLKTPFKSVVRFKSVSKSWQSIISGPRFSRTHRMQRSELLKNQNKFLIWSRNHPQRLSAGHTISLIGFKDGEFRSESQLDLQYESQNFMFPLCSCDGLFLLSNEFHNHYTLWNPSIRKHTAIRPRLPKNSDAYPWMHHLYFDPSSDDYKIVFVYENSYTVYSCNNGSCGKMKALPRGINRLHSPFFLDGCLYGEYNDGVVCFDVRDGNLHKFRMPVSGIPDGGIPDGRIYLDDRLKAVSGRLCFLGLSEEDICRVQLWVMEKNGSFEKRCIWWRELFSREIPANIWWRLDTLWFSDEGCILYRQEEESEERRSDIKLYVCDPRQDSFQPVEFN